MILNNNYALEKLKVSIVVPTLNEEKNISKLIKSLLNQTFLPDEIIISDAGSTDNTLNIISNFTKNNNKIKILKRKGKCRGSGRNEGIMYANNYLLALIDSGMIPEKQWLYNLVNNLQKNIIYDVVFGSVIFSAKSFLDRSLSATYIDKKNNVNYLIPSVASMLITKSAWEKVGGFPESLDGTYIVEDLVFIDKINSSNISKLYAPHAKVNWIIEFSFLAVMKRFYEYSTGGLKAGYYKTWHKGLIRNIIFLIILLIFSFKISFIFFFLIFILFYTLNHFFILNLLTGIKKVIFFRKLIILY